MKQSMNFLFQSTHPSWGATEYKKLEEEYSFLKISIHAPIVGCDINIHHQMEKYISISIHAPIVGCDEGE